MQIPGIQIRAFVALVMTSTGLGACSGGSTGVMQPVAFTSFSAIKSGQPVQANGISQTVSATTTPLGVVTATSINPVDTANSTATLTYNAPPAMSAFSFSTPTSSVSFSGMNVVCTTDVCRSSGTNAPAAAMNPLNPAFSVPAWNYQSFGYWLATVSATSSVAGAISFGSPSLLAAIPATGNATYKGLSGGIYVDQAGASFVQSAQMTSIANFGTLSIAFSTSGTTTAPVGNPNVTSPASLLDLTGNLTIGPGNQFSGTVKSAGTGGTLIMTGTATGQFYGPAVGPAVPAAPAEIGGIYSLKGTGTQTMVGGFGGKQQ